METFAHVAQVSQQFIDKAARGDSLALGGVVIIAGLVAASGFMVSPSAVTAASSRFVLPFGGLLPLPRRAGPSHFPLLRVSPLP